MTAEFEVHHAFRIEDRSLFGLSGTLVSGMVQTGMQASLEGDPEAFDARVHTVEFRAPTGRGKEEAGTSAEGGSPEASASEPALLFYYSRPEKLERWEAIEWPGRRLWLSW